MIGFRSPAALLLSAGLSFPALSFGQFLQPLPGAPARTTAAPTKTMTIEIWSDVVCPFCYIGKREFENALARFPHANDVTVEWKSFELDPNAPKRSEHDMYGMLVAKYGGNVFHRTSRKRFPIERMFGPSIPKEMVKDQTLETFERSGNAIMDRTMHELSRIL